MIVEWIQFQLRSVRRRAGNAHGENRVDVEWAERRSALARTPRIEDPLTFASYVKERSADHAGSGVLLLG